MAVKAAAKLSSFVPICHNLMERRMEKKRKKKQFDMNSFKSAGFGGTRKSDREKVNAVVCCIR